MEVLFNLPVEVVSNTLNYRSALLKHRSALYNYRSTCWSAVLPVEASFYLCRPADAAIRHELGHLAISFKGQIAESHEEDEPWIWGSLWRTHCAMSQPRPIRHPYPTWLGMPACTARYEQVVVANAVSPGRFPRTPAKRASCAQPRRHRAVGDRRGPV